MGEQENLEKEYQEAKEELEALLKQKKSGGLKGKKVSIKVVILSFVSFLILLLLFIKITGARFVDQMHGLGNIFLWIGILVGFVGVALVLKEKDAKADEEDVSLNKEIVQKQLQLDEIEDKMKNMEESHK